MISETFRMTVPFFDLDPMHIVWHGNYCKYLELARCKLLDKIGFGYQKMAESGYSFPVIDMRLKFVKSASFGQEIDIVATLVEWEYQIKINYTIQDARTGTRLTQAYTKQATVESSTGAMRLNCPAILGELMAKLLSK